MVTSRTAATRPVYMLDTITCIYIMKFYPPRVKERLHQCPLGTVSISSIVLAELWHGIHKSQQKKHNMIALTNFLSFCRVEAWPEEAATIYGEIRIDLERLGKIIGGNDLLIAAHAIVTDSILVTNNVKEFQRIIGLQVNNWI